MREKWQKQMPLKAHILDHAQSQELEMISGIIDESVYHLQPYSARLE
jgi:hypothetical protein